MSYLACTNPKCHRVATPVLEVVIESRPRDLGGFSVRRVLPSARRRMVGPFIFFDHIGPARFEAGQGIDVRPHPHIGLATVTYLFEGEILHRDSLGYVQPIRPGAVNWMTAGRGIVHSERTPPGPRASGARLHGIQSWVALPSEQEEIAPSFVHHPADTLPRIERDGVELYLIAGQAYGEASSVRTLSSMFYLEARMSPGTEIGLPEGYTERAVYLAEGGMSVDGQPLTPGSMAVLSASAAGRLRALQSSRAMLLGGEPVGQRHIWWNFVAGRRERIEQAKLDWQAGRFAPVPGEVEFIPLPES